MLQGLTAQYLVRDSHVLRSGESVLVHAAAGGVGELLVQLAKSGGVRVFALASTAEKCATAIAARADAAAGDDDDRAAQAHAFDKGGVDVVYDSVGSTVHDSLLAVRNRGHVVFYGMAGGDPDPVDPRLLMDGSKTLIGGDLWNVVRSAGDRLDLSAKLFARLQDGSLRVAIDSRYPLAEGAAAHAHLESRLARGKVLLIP